MEFGCVLADGHELRERPFVKIIPATEMRGVAEDVEIIQVVGLLRPERLKDFHGIGITFDKEIAETQQVARLERIGLVAENGVKRRNRGGVFTAPIVRESDVQADAGLARGQYFGLMEPAQSLFPLLAAHGDYPEVGVSAGGVR